MEIKLDATASATQLKEAREPEELTPVEPQPDVESREKARRKKFEKELDEVRLRVMWSTTPRANQLAAQYKQH